MTLVTLAFACGEPKPAPGGDAKAAPVAQQRSSGVPGTPDAPGTPTPQTGAGLRLFEFAAGTDLRAQVVERRKAAAAQGRTLLVYVGATWCEPCVHFHKAVAAGELDADFPNLDLLEIDFDLSKDAVQANGYAARLLPTFVVPDSQGKGSGVLEQGGIKGVGAVQHIVPRLKRLVQKAQGAG